MNFKQIRQAGAKAKSRDAGSLPKDMCQYPGKPSTMSNPGTVTDLPTQPNQKEYSMTKNSKYP